MSQRIALNEADFALLVHGRVVKKDGVELILSDIGFSVMVKILKDAMETDKENAPVAQRTE